MMRISRMGAAAMVLLGGSLAMAQGGGVGFPAGSAQAQAPQTGRDDTTLVDDLPHEYWLGIECFPVPPALRAQLNLPEKEGLLVGNIASDSPAAKAGIAQHDILLRAGDKPLAEPRDLVQAVQAAKEAKLAIELIHGGQRKTIEATPAKRPEEARLVMPAPGDRETVQKWLEQMQRMQQMQPEWREGQGSPLQFHFFGPGAIVPPGVNVEPALPSNVTVAITKEADQPLKIVVKRGDEKWEVTEKGLDKLPAELRPYVEHLLGRHMFGMLAPQSPGTPENPPRPGLGPLESRLEKRLEAMEQRIDNLRHAIEEMAGSHAAPKSPEPQDEKGK